MEPTRAGISRPIAAIVPHLNGQGRDLVPLGKAARDDRYEIATV